MLLSFISAIDAEIAEIEKAGREQTYELLSGQRDEKSTGTLYVFVLADALRLPEDASGTLKVEGRDIGAMVVSVEGNRIWLLLEAVDELPAYLPSARLVINETDLLRRLKEKIEGLRSAGDYGLAPLVFGLSPPHPGYRHLKSSVSHRFDEHGARVLEQCLGSDVTYVWGPPGTGKTFTIAGLAAAIAELGETVLVTSHTHAAVEQALWALVEPPSGDRDPGLLYGSALLDEGRVLKVGELKSEKMKSEEMKKVHLNSYLGQKAKEREENIGILEEERVRVAGEVSEAKEQLRRWRLFHEAEALSDRTSKAYEESLSQEQTAGQQIEHERQRVSDRQAELAKAERSFLIGRSARVRNAALQLNVALTGLSRAQARAGEAEARVIKAARDAKSAELNLSLKQSDAESLRPEHELSAVVRLGEERFANYEAQVAALRDSAAEDAKNLVENAVAIFATLTKLYVDRNLLPEMKWDTVIVDEVSMAMPPLLAYAASRAKKRVIVVGDMYQLPPVVNSERESQGGVLAKDVFELTGITDIVDARRSLPQLTKLTNQRRMHPDIAAGAKALIETYAYLTDHPDVLTRPRPSFLDALATQSALVVVDTSDLHPWSGKMPGSLSRFNFISGQAAVEIAALYANCLDEPDERTAPPIGIVTPYAAQRRYLNKLIQMFDLGRWVMAGTVHTFQGNECDVIIFDSVLGEPHWTSRFTTPADWLEVRRDLNVAVTRARHQFVFLGDARWLRKNARPGTGFGKLWPYLNEKAVQLTASAVLGDGFKERVSKNIPEVRGWGLKSTDKAVLMTEVDFYAYFLGDLSRAAERVILYTPFIGKTRWPQVAPAVEALRQRGVEVFVLHKPLTDPEWRRGDPEFGRSVFKFLDGIGVRLIPMSGVHAKTIVIDSEIVYEGSLNWASQTSSYEHMWRIKSGDMAKLVERMLQLDSVVKAYAQRDVGDRCPACGGPLVLINQAQQSRQGRQDVHPFKLGCLSYFFDRNLCSGYLRRVDGRPPFLTPPVCSLGTRMKLNYSPKTGCPWDWSCGHAGCKRIRWARGDWDGSDRKHVVPAKPRPTRLNSLPEQGAPMTSPPADASSAVSPIAKALRIARERGLQVVDFRANDGALWIIGGEDLTDLLSPLRFSFAPAGSRGTKGRAAWYSK